MALENIIFEVRRLYVPPRKSVLFFARVGEQRVRCYVKQDALIESAPGADDQLDLYQRCLLAFDQRRDSIHIAAARLLEANITESDGAVVVSRTALVLETEALDTSTPDE
jgi:hypothetical protein